MQYVDEYRMPERVKPLIDRIRRITSRPWKIMEVCGGQTHAILRYGLEELLPPEVAMIHGPGCPVCVTPAELIDWALALAALPEVILCSFGDMMRVPGSGKDLLTAKAEGADVRTVYSPLEAVELARRFPEREVIFFAIGFETTAPANAMAVLQAEKENLSNFSLLSAQVAIPPAIEAILTGEAQVEGLLAPGHVCAVTGWKRYRLVSQKYSIPVAVTGFEPADILQGILAVLLRLENRTPGVDNVYARAVREEGNIPAQAAVNKVFRTVDRNWRGLGIIPESGLDLQPEYAVYDAAVKFEGLTEISGEKRYDCPAGQVLQGLIKPPDCFAFGKECTPDSPLGAPMVSSEGACAAYFKYKHRL